MKILCLSDLHLYFIQDYNRYELYKSVLSNSLHDLDFDCIVISGDIFEASFNGNPYKTLRNLFSFISSDIPIICCLGNHEFAYRTIDKTLRFYNSIPKDARYNVYYLDVDNSFSFDHYNFIGNVFWYDNTLLNNILGSPDKIDKDWLDATIKDFIPSVENNKCKKQIFDNLKNNFKNILVTHTVPHIALNRFTYTQPNSLYNQYSGCKDFLAELKDKNVVASICGHTHQREMKEIYGIKCINIGNDYFNFNYGGSIEYYVAEV